jgi:hypothetical protein
MRRREFITLLSGAAAWPVVARAQTSDRMRRVVVAIIMTENDPQSAINVRAVRHGLTESGWAEGRSFQESGASHPPCKPGSDCPQGSSRRADRHSQTVSRAKMAEDPPDFIRNAVVQDSAPQPQIQMEE